MWNLKYDTIKPIYETEIESEAQRKDVIANAGVGEGSTRSWVIRCKLVYVGCVNNKVLPYSTGNYIQYPAINHNGKEYEKEYIYMYN